MSTVSARAGAILMTNATLATAAIAKNPLIDVFIILLPTDFPK
jgi:hypothetical protein